MGIPGHIMRVNPPRYDRAKIYADDFDKFIAEIHEKSIPLWFVFYTMAVEGARKNGPRPQYRSGTPRRFCRTRARALAQVNRTSEELTDA